MDYYTIRRMRTSKSDHSVMQDARIDALLKEMQPGRHNRSLQISNNTDFQPAPPNYDVIFPQKHAPPPYSQLVRRTVNSTWNVDFESEPENFPTWTMNANQLATMEKTTTHNSLMSTISLPNGVVSKSVLPPRNSPRQASFIAAMSRHEQYATMRCCVRQQTTPQLSRRTAVNHTTTQTSRRENRRTTVFGDRIFSKESSQHVSCRDMNHNAVTKMRRARPKSYVLATSTSFPETEQMSFSQDESRELSSLGSLSSIDRTPRLANREHNHSHAHRIQKFIAFFTHQNSPTKLRAKRSLTSLPLSRDPLPTTVLRASKLIRQGWLRHQELALGKSGKRRSWEECWAMLYEQSLYLCAQEPVATIAETTGEKLIHLPPFACVDVHSSIIDIAYEWLAMSRTKHVIRLVTQTRTEHLFELDSEAEMLSWIATLQSCAEGTMSPQLYSSCSTLFASFLVELTLNEDECILRDAA